MEIEGLPIIREFHFVKARQERKKAEVAQKQKAADKAVLLETKSDVTTRRDERTQLILEVIEDDEVEYSSGRSIKGLRVRFMGDSPDQIDTISSAEFYREFSLPGIYPISFVEYESGKDFSLNEDDLEGDSICTMEYRDTVHIGNGRNINEFFNFDKESIKRGPPETSYRNNNYLRRGVKLIADFEPEVNKFLKNDSVAKLVDRMRDILEHAGSDIIPSTTYQRRFP